MAPKVTKSRTQGHVYTVRRPGTACEGQNPWGERGRGVRDTASSRAGRPAEAEHLTEEETATTKRGRQGLK